MRVAKNAPRGPFYVLERFHGLAEIVECGAGVPEERPDVIPPRLERKIMRITEGSSRHGSRFAHKCLGFCVAMQIHKGRRVRRLSCTWNLRH